MRLDGGWWPMAVGVRRVLRDAGLEQVTIVRRGRPDGLPWIEPSGEPITVCYERDDGRAHPLWGVVMALSSCRGNALVVPCDLPWLTVHAVHELIEASPPAVAWDGVRVHPLVGLYDASMHDRARDLAREGGAVHQFAEGAERITIDEVALGNANRPEDLNPGPVACLTAGLYHLDEVECRVAVAAERARLRLRGVVDM